MSGAERQADISETKIMAKTNEMRILIKGTHFGIIKGVTKLGMTEDVVSWTRARRRFWNDGDPKTVKNRQK